MKRCLASCVCDLAVKSCTMFPGKIKYSVDKILLSNLSEHGINPSDLLTHDECLHLLSQHQNNQKSVSNDVGGGDSCEFFDSVVLLKSNYAWVFKNSNEMNNNERCFFLDNSTSNDVDEYISKFVNDHKILAIPPARLLGPRSLLGNRQVATQDIFGKSLIQTILLDKFAHYFELLSLLVERGVLSEKEKNVKISTLIARNNSAAIKLDMENYCQTFAISHEILQARVNKNIRFIRNMCSIPLLNDKPGISFLQGRDSEIRNAIPKKVLAFRAQVVAQPCLQADQVMLPLKWACKFPSLVYCHRGQCEYEKCAFCRRALLTGQTVEEIISAQPSHEIRVYDPSRLDSSVPLEYQYQLKNAALIMKRDPVINLGSFSAHTTVIFTHGNLFRVCLELMERKGEDVDGDSEIGKQVIMSVSILEIILNASPEFNMLIYNQPRITFTESIILYMHRRDFDNNAFKYAKIYKWIRRRETYNWLSNVHNRNALERLAQRTRTDWNIFEYAEPTRLILTKTLTAIAMILGSQEAFKFYNCIRKHVLDLSNSIADTNNPLYDSKLPADYTMTDDLLNPTLLAICASESRGCIESYDIFTKQLYDLDGTTKIGDNINTLTNESNFFSNVTNIMQTMAKKSRLVRVNGHNFFKATIGFETMSFHNHAQTIVYNNRCILHEFEMVDCVLLPPYIAALLTFCSQDILF